MIVNPTEDNIKAAVSALHIGSLVGLPTETVYGLAADCFNIEAVGNIFKLKNRPATDPLIVHISNFKQLETVAVINSEQQKLLDLLKVFWPGPLTVILPKNKNIPDIVSAGLDTVAVRMPAHPVALKLIELSGPLAAPSANISTKVSPTKAEHVLEEFGDNLKIILDGGACQIGLESTIVDISDTENPKLLRPGGITLEDLKKILPNIEEITQYKTSSEIQNAPGQLIEHYCPNTALVFLSQAKIKDYKKIGLITLSPDCKVSFPVFIHKHLSIKGSLEEAAQNLFAAIRELDKLSLDVILIEEVVSDGIGRAIMDRLQRATARFRKIS